MEIHDFVIIIRAEFLLRFVPHPRDYPYLDTVWFWVLIGGVFLAAARTISPTYTCILSSAGLLAGYFGAGAVFMAGWLMPLWNLAGRDTAAEAGGVASLAGLALVAVVTHMRTLVAPEIEWETGSPWSPARNQYINSHLHESDDDPDFAHPHIFPWSD